MGRGGKNKANKTSGSPLTRKAPLLGKSGSLHVSSAVSEELTKRELDNGTIEFLNSEGKLHREDGPAVIYPDGSEAWYKEGKLHREDGPAVKYDGGEEWYREGFLHREDGPAIISDESIEWYKNGELHREDGPARILPEVEEWYKEGLLHRADGPARTTIDGTKEWYLNGAPYRAGGPIVVRSEEQESLDKEIEEIEAYREERRRKWSSWRSNEFDEVRARINEEESRQECLWREEDARRQWRHMEQRNRKIYRAKQRFERQRQRYLLSQDDYDSLCARLDEEELKQEDLWREEDAQRQEAEARTGRCQGCHEKFLTPSDKFCARCGLPAKKLKDKCECGRELEESWNFCVECRLPTDEEGLLRREQDKEAAKL